MVCYQTVLGLDISITVPTVAASESNEEVEMTDRVGDDSLYQSDHDDVMI